MSCDECKEKIFKFLTEYDGVQKLSVKTTNICNIDIVVHVLVFPLGKGIMYVCCNIRYL